MIQNLKLETEPLQVTGHPLRSVFRVFSTDRLLSLVSQISALNFVNLHGVSFMSRFQQLISKWVVVGRWVG